DGVVGPHDLAELNRPVQERIREIELNMERWRWLPSRLGDRYVVANIPGFTLDLVEDGRSQMDMRIVVGRQFSATPLFSDRITAVVLNPVWNVPRTIAGQEMLPLIEEDPDYLARENIRVFDGSGPDAGELDPGSVSWWAQPQDDMTVVLRQEPGPSNPLGRIKFVCPNAFDVYLHDTPAGHL